jgi:hypothetical protein
MTPQEIAIWEIAIWEIAIWEIAIWEIAIWEIAIGIIGQRFRACSICPARPRW